jgi:RNA polymerase Rpb2, domain 7
MQELTSMVS